MKKNVLEDVVVTLLDIADECANDACKNMPLDIHPSIRAMMYRSLFKLVDDAFNDEVRKRLHPRRN